MSIPEAIARLEDLVGTRLKTEYVEENRVGGHCYISDLSGNGASFVPSEQRVRA